MRGAALFVAGAPGAGKTHALEGGGGSSSVAPEGLVPRGGGGGGVAGTGAAMEGLVPRAVSSLLAHLSVRRCRLTLSKPR